MSDVTTMLETHPNDSTGVDRTVLAECIAACFACAQSCNGPILPSFTKLTDYRHVLATSDRIERRDTDAQSSKATGTP